jgi:hypothetical protein
MAQKRVKIQLRYDFVDRVEEVAQQLRDAGFTIQDQIPSIGHFSGVADEGVLEHLKSLPSVASVNPMDDADDYSIS